MLPISPEPHLPATGCGLQQGVGCKIIRSGMVVNARNDSMGKILQPEIKPRTRSHYIVNCSIEQLCLIFQMYNLN
jgi:hypothetical protein